MERLTHEREVVVPDLPGFGASPPPPDDDWSVPGLTRAVAAWLAAEGLERPHVAGNSLGGAIALELGRLGHACTVCGQSPVGFQRGPERAYTMGSLQTMAAIARHGRPALRALESFAAGRTLVGGQIFGRPWKAPPDALEHATVSIRTAPGFDRALPLATAWDWTHGDLDVPVTIAWGTQDRLLLPHQALRARRVMPRARHRWLRGCGHIAVWDDPDRFARVLLEASVDDAEDQQQDQGHDGREQQRAEAAQAVREEEEHRPGPTR